MQTRIEVDGDDVVIVIPPEILDQAEMQIGEEIELSIEKGTIVIKRCN